MSVPRDPVSRSPEAPTLVVGLGNPVLGDDAVGWRVAEALRTRLGIDDGGVSTTSPGGPAVEIDCLALGGLRLMERLVGYERAIVVDALVTGNRPAGSVGWEELEIPSEPVPTHTGSAHDTSLATALQVGRALGARLPSDVRVLGIEAGPCFEFGETLSPAVAAAVPRAVDLLLEELQSRGGSGRKVGVADGPASERRAPNIGSIGTGTDRARDTISQQ